MEKLGAPPDLKVEIHKRSIFSVYDENYSDAVLPKEKPRVSYPETNLTEVFEFNPKDVPVKPQPIDYLKGERDGAAADKAQRAIRLAADVNDLLENHQFEGAEILLGRKLRQDEIRDQFVKDLMKPKLMLKLEAMFPSQMMKTTMRKVMYLCRHRDFLSRVELLSFLNMMCLLRSLLLFLLKQLALSQPLTHPMILRESILLELLLRFWTSGESDFPICKFKVPEGQPEGQSSIRFSEDTLLQRKSTTKGCVG
jgi:hypothetical protein